MERIAVKMSRKYGFATASAVERIPMDNNGATAEARPWMCVVIGLDYLCLLHHR